LELSNSIPADLSITKKYIKLGDIINFEYTNTTDILYREYEESSDKEAYKPDLYQIEDTLYNPIYILYNSN
jgi:hypothetical protein